MDGHLDNKLHNYGPNKSSHSMPLILWQFSGIIKKSWGEFSTPNSPKKVGWASMETEELGLQQLLSPSHAPSDCSESVLTFSWASESWSLSFNTYNQALSQYTMKRRRISSLNDVS